MVLSKKFKNKIMGMISNKNFDGVIRDLRKIHIMNINDLELDMDKYFVLYDLARAFYEKNNFEISNYYLKELKNIFNRNNIGELQVAYHNYLWLNVNVNSKTMSAYDITKDMLKVYNYYDSIGMNDVAIAAIGNIFNFSGDGEKLLSVLDKLLKCPVISDWNFVHSALRNCKRIDEKYYIKAVELVKRYDTEFNIDVI